MHALELYGSLSSFSQNTFGNYGYGVMFEIGYFETQQGRVLDARYNTWNQYGNLGSILFDNETILSGSWPMINGNSQHR